MSALTSTPENDNFLAQNGYTFYIKKCPTVNFFVQEFEIPEINLPSVLHGSPFVSIPSPGDHIAFASLSISFKVDEDLKNYLELHNWIKQTAPPTKLEDHKEIYNQPKYSGMGIKSDITVMILNSNLRPKFEVVFIDAFPTKLSGITFTAKNNDIQYIQADAIFDYLSYDINPVQ